MRSGHRRASKMGLVAILLVTLLAGCGGARARRAQGAPAPAAPQPGLTAGDVSGQMVFQGMTRTYLLHTPPGSSPDQPLPLVIVLHGGGGGGARFAAQTRFSAVADQEHFIAIYPDANRTRWADGRFDDPVDDVAYIGALIGHVIAMRAIDSRRIYAVGLSNGGLFAQRLACQLADRIAAVATVVATMSIPVSKTCRPARPLAVMLMNGTEDPLMPWRGGTIPGRQAGMGGGEVVSTAEVVEIWRRNNACAGTGKVEQLPDTDPSDGTRVQRTAYGPCRAGSEVVLISVVGGGHNWPGRDSAGGIQERLTGRTSRDIDAGPVIWGFLRTHSLP